MNILVTGATGFVGARLVPRLGQDGHAVVAAVRAGEAGRNVPGAQATVELELTDPGSVRAVCDRPVDAVIHLAALASGAEGEVDPGRAYEVNTAGTARLAEVFGVKTRRGTPVRMLVVSTGLVYGGAGTVPFVESCPLQPTGPYAVSKCAAEFAALDVYRRLGLDVIVARPFSHTGAGQDDRFVVPAFARRIAEARMLGAPAIGVGNLAPVRDFLHVDDVVEAYVALLAHGRPGEAYNVASGRPTTIQDLFHLVADAVGYRVVPEVDTAFVRVGDTPYSVGDASKLRSETGWAPARTLQDAIHEVVHA